MTSSTEPNSLDEAFAYCRVFTRSHYENFPVGSVLIPRALRPHVHSIYTFARIADDFADEPGMDPEERLSKLEEWQNLLDSCLEAPRGPVFTALAETIRQHQIPVSLLSDLLLAFRSDATTDRHQTFEDLTDYCRFSANPVGRLILHLFQYRSPSLGNLSDAICTALQLTNFWQDVAVDYKRNRVYLPAEEMNRFGVTETDLAEGRLTDGFCRMMASLIDRTRCLFEEGRMLPEQLKGRLKYELRMTWHGGGRILDEIERDGYDVFNKRPKLSRRDMVSVFGRSLTSASPVLPSHTKPGDPG